MAGFFWDSPRALQGRCADDSETEKGLLPSLNVYQ